MRERVLAWAGQATAWYTFFARPTTRDTPADAMYSDGQWNSSLHNGFMTGMPYRPLHLSTQGVH